MTSGQKFTSVRILHNKSERRTVAQLSTKPIKGFEMTTSTPVKTAKFVVVYNVSGTVEITVERPENITQTELRESITYDELGDNQTDAYFWEGLKDAWQCDYCDAYTADEDGNIEDSMVDD